jgi:hypothetical protein
MPYTFPGAVVRASDWRAHAACRDEDPELFFPTGTTGPLVAAQTRAALDVCAVCPVRAECLEEALARIPYGIAGGLTEAQRDQLKRGRARAARRARETGTPARAQDVSAPPDDAPDLRPSVHDPRGQVRARGIEMLTRGRPHSEIADACRVSPRTVERWAALPAVRTAARTGRRVDTTPWRMVVRADARRAAREAAVS